MHTEKIERKQGLFSTLAIFLLIILAIGFRINYSVFQEKSLQVTTWDALGYYQYLPAVFIYNDVSKLDWFEKIEKKYNLSGGYIYQNTELDNGNRVGKYFCGVAIMETPFFLIGHLYATISDYPPDGFSAPYQYSIAFGVILYFFIALVLLRLVLLKYFKDSIVAFTLIFLVLGTNLIQYVAIAGSMSHSFLFLLYAMLLYFTVKWHENPQKKYAALIGFIIGFAIISRPTEAIMIFIPVLWGISSKESRKQKLDLIKSYKSHLIYAFLYGALALLPQIIYWKIVTGDFIYDVGSKWVFLNPWFRVLFGFEKGWFIYTPLTIFFIIGFFFSKKYDFQKSVIWFSILNIWIIISWYDWRYGGTYSTRALVQSYPVFSLSFAAFISYIFTTKFKFPFIILAIYLTGVNLFQIKQYNDGILLNDGMTYEYYKSIYLNTNPKPLDMSLLSTK